MTDTTVRTTLLLILIAMLATGCADSRGAMTPTIEATPQAPSASAPPRTSTPEPTLRQPSPPPGTPPSSLTPTATVEPPSSESLSVVVQETARHSISVVQDGIFRRSVSAPELDYEILSEDDFHLFDVPGAQPNVASGAPVLPIVEVTRLWLPSGGRITAAEVVSDVVETIGPLHVPTVKVGPFSEGGLTYEAMSPVDQFFPDQILTYYPQAESEWLFLFQPFQYNPMTQEVRLHQAGSIEIEYSAPIPLVLGQIETSRPSYAAEEPVELDAMLSNLSAAPLSLEVSVSLLDPYGEMVESAVTGPVSVGPGSDSLLQLIWTPVWAPGNWTVVMSLSDLEQNLLAASSVSVVVR